MAETVKQHVFSCTLELAKKVPFALVSLQVQDETPAALRDERPFA